MGDNIFELDDLVDSYRVVPSTSLEENLNFHITESTFVNVNFEELNDVLRINRHKKIDKDDDNDKFNVKDCDGDDGDGDKIEEEKDYFD